MGEPLFETGAVHYIITELTLSVVVGVPGLEGAVAHKIAKVCETTL